MELLQLHLVTLFERVCFCLISYVFSSAFSSFMSRSIFSLRLVSLSVAALADLTSSEICSSSPSQLIRLCRSELLRHLHGLFPEHDDLVHLLVASATSSSRCVMSCLLLLLRAAAAALRCGFGRSAASFFGAWTFSLARVSFSWTIPSSALSTSPLSLSIVPGPRPPVSARSGLRPVGDDLRVEVAALLDEPLLAVV